MQRAARVTGVVFGVALLGFLALGASALAQEPESEQLMLSPSRDSGVSGTATVTEDDGGVRIELSVQGLPEGGVKHINHFHAGGTCADDRVGNPAPATIPLKTLVANDDGTSSATTNLRDITLTELFDPGNQRYFAVHSKVEDDPVPPVISCSDVIRASVGVPSGSLPHSGGPRIPMLALWGASILAILSGSLALRRFGKA